MAEVILKDENTIEVVLAPEETIEAELPDINYIPGYVVAEKERRAYYEDFKERVESGEFNGKDGEKGEPGTPGKDGTVTFEELTEEQKASLKGEKGDKGDPGEPGEDGYTPIKGVDYFTELDIEAIVNEVLARIPSSEGVDY